MLRIAVTGASGTIGFQLIKWLIKNERCDRVVALVEDKPLPYDHETLSQLRGDILDVAVIDELCAGCDVIIHMAARNPYSAHITRDEYLEFLTVNALGTAVTSKFARKHGKRMILTSSIAVYVLNPRVGEFLSEDLSLPLSDATELWVQRAYELFDGWADALIGGDIAPSDVRMGEFLEENPIPGDENIYAISKILAERFVSQWPDSTILRLSDVYGPGDETPKMTPVLIRQAHDQEEMVWFDGRNGICPVYLGDVLRALYRSSVAESVSGTRTFNITGDLVDPESFMQTIRQCVDSESAVSDTYRHTELETPLQFNHEKAARELEIEFVALQEGMSRSVDYYKVPSSARNTYVIE